MRELRHRNMRTRTATAMALPTAFAPTRSTRGIRLEVRAGATASARSAKPLACREAGVPQCFIAASSMASWSGHTHTLVAKLAQRAVGILGHDNKGPPSLAGENMKPGARKGSWRSKV